MRDYKTYGRNCQYTYYSKDLLDPKANIRLEGEEVSVTLGGEIILKGQSKKHSWYEAWLNIFIGSSVNYLANIYILPLFFQMSLPTEDYIKLTLIYTVISLVRSYGLRRIFNYFHTRH